jgi:NodT family efflux transporter outer membrane factor (OMF) lipoprotein
MKIQFPLKCGFLIVISSLLSACAFFPQQSLPEKESKSLAVLEPQLSDQEKLIEDSWWKAFEDPQLDQLISMGLSNSPSLEISGARILAAQAMLDTERAAFIPQIGVNGQVDRQQLSQNYIFVPGMPIYTGYGLINASLNWSLDIWGKQRKYYDAAKNQLKAAQANHRASELLLSTTIARIYLDYDRLSQTQSLFDEDAQIKTSLYEIAQSRFKTGLVDEVVVGQRKIEMEIAQANLNQSKLSVKMAQHQLAALVQMGPAWGESLKPPAISVKNLTLPERIPANLLERRPDLQALLSQIDASRLQLEGAKLEYLPDLNLAGFVGVQSFGLSQLFASKSQQFSIGPAINLPIFDGGLINANVTAKEAGRNQDIANYQEQLVQALREVADGIGSSQSSQMSFEQTERAYKAAKKNYHLQRAHF